LFADKRFFGVFRGSDLPEKSTYRRLAIAMIGKRQPVSEGERSRAAFDLLGFVSMVSIACFIVILFVVAGSFPGARAPLSLVIIGLGAGALILLRQLRKAANTRAMAEARANYAATHDALTRLPNKPLFLDRLAGVMAGASEAGAGAISVFCIGIDRFEEVSEVLGAEATDQVAIELAARLSTAFGDRRTVARLADDTFGLIYQGAGAAEALGGKIVKLLSAPYEASGDVALITCSVGVNVLPPGPPPPSEAYRQAKLALTDARKLGGGHARVFQPSMDHALRRRKALEVDLRRALAEGEMMMVYQPQVSGKGAMVGVEALMRWPVKEGEGVSPSVFVPLAESCGLSEALGRFALRQAFLDARGWNGLKVAINISAAQVRSGALVPTLQELLAETGANPKNFELEITEGLLLADEPQTHRALSAIRKLGFSIALDDFGTGYSSLSYLRHFPIDKIKIDQSFVSHLGARPESSAIIKAILDLSEALELRVIAEGVETRAQADRLAALGCRLYQGYFYSKPVSALVIQEMLTERTKLAA
jgi:diguanylate cyclase (GGDEF)-like protein